MKVSCFNCKYFIKTVIHISEKNILSNKDKAVDLSLCNKFGFRIFDKKDSKILCNFHTPIEPKNHTNDNEKNH